MIARRLTLLAPVWLCVLTGALLALSAAPAFALTTHPFEFSFNGGDAPGGPFSRAVADAVDQASGDVYVLDEGTGVVDKFNADGTYAGVQITGASTPQGSFSLTYVSGVAVDDSGGVTDGDVYVADTYDGVVDRFSSSGAYLCQITGAATPSASECNGAAGSDTPAGSITPAGVAVDSSGDVYVADRANDVVDEFGPSGNYVTQISNPNITSPGTIALDPSGNLYVTNITYVGVNVVEFNAAGEFVGTVDDEDSLSVGVDPTSGHVYVADEDGTINENDESGTLVDTFGSRGFVIDLAVSSSTGDIYADDLGNAVVNVFGPLATIPDAATGQASSVTTAGATLNGTVDPEGTTITDCHFAYVDDADYSPSAANPYSAGGTIPCANTPTGSSPVAVSAEVSGLTPGTVYHFGLVAANASGSVAGSDQTFTTGARIDVEYATTVTADSATLDAQIDPLGDETTYHFEYGTTTSYGTGVPVPEADVGLGTSDVSVSQHLQGLQASTTYHYRAVATTSAGTNYGPDQTFTTQAPAGGPALPDGREWELVSPADKLGAQALPTSNSLTQASEDGGAISYLLAAPFVANPLGNDQLAQAISRRGPGGWSTEDIATPHNGPADIGGRQEYDFFSPDLAYGLVWPHGETPLSPETTEKTPYLRDDATGVYTPLVTAANVPPDTKFGHEPGAAGEAAGVQFVTASPNLSHVVLGSVFALTPNAKENGQSRYYRYYEWTAGGLRLISVLPPGSSPSKVGIGQGVNERGAVPNNGSRIIWSASDPTAHVYVTDMADGEVLSVDAAQGVPEPNENVSQFQIAASEGSLVFFTDAQQLTANTSPGGGLYVYDVETGRLAPVTTAVNSGEEAGVQGLVLGVAEDGSEVYLVAKGVLSDTPNAEQEKAAAGADNLYVMHREVHGSTEAWTASFIATLSAGDETEWNPEVFMSHQTVEVSRNGQYLAFMSDRSLTGYDNRDAQSGEPDEEVYLYDADGGRLVCASCDPTGARPSGWLEPAGGQAPVSDLRGAWSGRWVAASIPGMTEVEGGAMAIAVSEPTYLMDSGRLFFDSRDALVARDVSGVGQVYEYEPGGVGGCAAGSGCVGLISGGVGSEESAFADASASGNDVFFVTAEPLVSEDVGTEYDMYDAHVCGAEVPCPSASAAVSPPCTTADSCRAAQAPQPGIFGAPASATFSGAGNVEPALFKPAVKPKAKALTRAQKLAKALRACRSEHRHSRRRRSACEKQAQRTYGTAHEATKSRKGGE
jgi:hypothetical protein